MHVMCRQRIFTVAGLLVLTAADFAGDGVSFATSAIRGPLERPGACGTQRTLTLFGLVAVAAAGAGQTLGTGLSVSLVRRRRDKIGQRSTEKSQGENNEPMTTISQEKENADGTVHSQTSKRTTKRKIS